MFGRTSADGTRGRSPERRRPAAGVNRDSTGVSAAGRNTGAHNEVTASK